MFDDNSEMIDALESAIKIIVRNFGGKATKSDLAECLDINEVTALNMMEIMTAMEKESDRQGKPSLISDIVIINETSVTVSDTTIQPLIKKALKEFKPVSWDMLKKAKENEWLMDVTWAMESGFASFAAMTQLVQSCAVVVSPNIREKVISNGAHNLPKALPVSHIGQRYLAYYEKAQL